MQLEEQSLEEGFQSDRFFSRFWLKISRLAVALGVLSTLSAAFLLLAIHHNLNVSIYLKYAGLMLLLPGLVVFWYAYVCKEVSMLPGRLGGFEARLNSDDMLKETLAKFSNKVPGKTGRLGVFKTIRIIVPLWKVAGKLVKESGLENYSGRLNPVDPRNQTAWIFGVFLSLQVIPGALITAVLIMVFN